MNKFENLFGAKSKQKRFQIFLCDVLNRHGIAIDHKALQDSEWQDLAVSFLNSNPSLLTEINFQSNLFIEEFYFEWINEKNKRQLYFVIEKIQKHYTPRKLFSTSILGIHVVYLLIDTAPMSIPDKFTLLKNIKIEWNNHLGKDKIFKWFREDSKNKIEFSWDWLHKKKPGLTENEKPFETFTDILNFFDQKIENYIERDYYIETIKKNWRQLVYRNKTSAKKQCNILLHQNTINVLDDLCDRYRLKKQEVIELLILSEQENNFYLKHIDPLPINRITTKFIETSSSGTNKTRVATEVHTETSSQENSDTA